MVLDNQFTDEEPIHNADNLVEPANTSVLDMHDVRDAIANSRTALQTELSNTPPENISAHDSALMNISQSDVTFSMIDTLQHHDIQTLTVDTDTLSNPRNALQNVFEAGGDALREQGFPSPDIEFYHTAQQTAQETGQDMRDVLDDMRDAQPLMMRQDLVPKDSIEFMPDTDTVHAAPEVDGPVAETQYDVHFMGYPLKHVDIGPLRIESRPSHAYIAVTERGMDPLNPENVLLATRAGPDEATQTIYLPDSALPEETQSPTEKTNSGNVYVANDEESRDSDVEHDHAFFVKTYEVDHDLETIRDMVDSHASLINLADIDYEVLNRNSNTYYGDITEILTGEEPPDYSFSDGLPRYYPAINNDLMDYSKTEFAEKFGHEPYQAETENQAEEHNYIPEEDYSYGID